MTPSRPTLTCRAFQMCGLPLAVYVASVPFARMIFIPRSWLDSDPYFMDDPCVPVAMAPPFVWSMNQL